MKLVYGYSQVKDGNMAVKYGEEQGVGENRKKFLKKLGLQPEACVWMSLWGGTEVHEVGKKDTGKYVEGDAAILKEPEVGVFMVTGDCFPVIIYHPEKPVLALVHCGFAGIDGGIAVKTIEALTKKGIPADELKVLIGPGARRESYSFAREEVQQKEKPEWKEFLNHREDGQTEIDLAGYLINQVKNCGIKPENIDDCGIDTITSPDYFSHYRSRRTGEAEGRFLTASMLRGGV